MPDSAPQTSRDDLGRLPRPPFHPHVQAVMDAVEIPSFTPERLAQLREQNRTDPSEMAEKGLVRTDHQVPGHRGEPITVSTWRHRDAPGGPGPGYVFLHGGGMVSGDRFGAGDIGADTLAEGGVLVTVDYRLAPEHPAPTPVEDCRAALVWAVEHAAELGIDPSRVVLAGTSAGGGLAAGVMLLLRDQGGPSLAGVWLNTPMLDDRSASLSVQQFDDLGLFWDGISNRTGWSMLLGDRTASPYDAPARATSLAGLPPVLVTVGSAEPFRDEAVEFASRLWADGGDCELLVVPGGTHCYASAVPEANISRIHRQVVDDWITHCLDPDDPAGAASAIEELEPLETVYEPSDEDRA